MNEISTRYLKHFVRYQILTAKQRSKCDKFIENKGDKTSNQGY